MSAQPAISQALELPDAADALLAIGRGLQGLDQAEEPSSRTSVADVQRMLADLGYSPGAPDGDPGPRTRKEIARFQAQAGLPSTGRLDRATLDRLAAAHAARPADPLPSSNDSRLRQGPSFDCVQAREPSELAICASDELAALDREMSARFRAARQGASGAQAEALLSQQRTWILSRDACGSDPGCLGSSMAARIDQIATGQPGSGSPSAAGAGAGRVALTAQVGPGSLASPQEPAGVDRGQNELALDEGPAAEVILFGDKLRDAVPEQARLIEEADKQVLLRAAVAIPELTSNDEEAMSVLAALDPDFAASLMDAAVDETSRNMVAGFREGGDVGLLLYPLTNLISSFERQRIMGEVRARLPDLLADVPAGPLDVQVVCRIHFEEYDFAAQAFPDPNVASHVQDCRSVQLGRRAGRVEGGLPGFPAELPLAPEAAEALEAEVRAASAGSQPPSGLVLLVSFRAKLEIAGDAPRTLNSGFKLSFRDVHHWRLHLPGHLDRVLHTYPDAGPAVASNLSEGPRGTTLLDGRIPVFVSGNIPVRKETGLPLVDATATEQALAAVAALAAIKNRPDWLADERKALEALALFPGRDRADLVAEATRSEPNYSDYGVMQPGGQSVASELGRRLSEFDIARLTDLVRTRLPSLVEAEGTLKLLQVRIFCQITLSRYDMDAGGFPLGDRSCPLAGLNLRIFGDTEYNVDMSALPGAFVMPPAEGEALLDRVATPRDPDSRSVLMSFDATLSGRIPEDRPNILVLDWVAEAPLRLHPVDDPESVLWTGAAQAPALSEPAALAEAPSPAPDVESDSGAEEATSSDAVPEREPDALAEPSSEPVVPPADVDVAGLRLGMTSDAFLAGAEGLFKPGTSLRLEVPNPDLDLRFGTVSGYISSDNSQTILAVHPPGRPDGPVLALYRRLVVTQEQTSLESIVSALVRKYGEPTERSDNDPGALRWTMTSSDDACMAGFSWMGQPPQLRIPETSPTGAGALLDHRSLVDGLFWPDNPPDPLRPELAAGCGPMIATRITDDKNGHYRLGVWLTDMNLMARTLSDPLWAPAPKEPAAPADIKL
nr:peptidoglycan-binding protein [Paracoccus sp. S-4012]